MGSQGMKRKDRRHLPKVGTAPEQRYAQQHERGDVLGNLGIHERHPTTTTETIGAVFVSVVVVVGMLAFILFT